MAKTYSPRCRMKFIDQTNDTEIADVSDDILSLTTNKGYGSPAGTWQVMLPYKPIKNKDGKRYDEFIKPNDLVTIEMKSGSDEWLPIMIGLVDRVGNTRPGGITPGRRVKISGQDLGKILVTHDIGWDVKQAYIKLTNQSTEKKEEKESKEWVSLTRIYNPTLAKGIPGKLVENLLEFAFKPILKLANKFELQTTTKDNWHTIKESITTLSGMNVWSGISKVANMPYNMLHTDTSPKDINKFMIYHEKQPIRDNGKLDRRITIELTDEEIISDDIGVSDHERVNFLFMNNPLYAIAASNSVDVLMAMSDLFKMEEASSDNAIEKHGLHLKTVDTIFYPPNVESVIPSKLTEFDDVRKRKDEIWNWHKNNHKLESGTFQVHLRPDIRAGQGIKVKQSDGTYKEFLVEQIAHQLNWHPTPSFMTTLHVTRGQKHE